MDLDYQMIDSHIDEQLKCKIQCFDYINFSKLLPRTRSREEDSRLELVTKNGLTFLSPVSERDSPNTQINSFIRWKQAFRIFSNVLTARFLQKATELLQYNHTIHTASMAYTWENVYAYDKEFRRHIGCHPTRSWSIILQQAWTMILKDRVKNDTFGKTQKGKKNEPCRRYNKGKCTFGLACRYEHRCSMPKCGKFGHGAHICCLRNGQNQDNHNEDKKKD